MKLVATALRGRRMSTKVTAAFGDNFHLYHEVMEDDNIYLQLDNVDFDVSKGQVTVCIPLEIWEHIRQFSGANFWAKDLTDDEIRAKVEKEVQNRIGAEGIMRMAGLFVYGSADDSKEEQIESGIKYHQNLRERQRLLHEKIEALNKRNPQ